MNSILARHYTAADVLLDAGCRVDLRNSHKMTAYDLAASWCLESLGLLSAALEVEHEHP